MSYLKKAIGATFGAAVGALAGVTAGSTWVAVDNLERADIMNAAIQRYVAADREGPAVLNALAKNDPEVAWVVDITDKILWVGGAFAFSGGYVGAKVSGRKRKEPGPWRDVWPR